MTISGAAFSNTVQGKPVCSNRLVKFCLVRSVVDASMAVQYHLISLGDGEQSRVVELFLTIFSFLFFFFKNSRQRALDAKTTPFSVSLDTSLLLTVTRHSTW